MGVHHFELSLLTYNPTPLRDSRLTLLYSSLGC
nr:MAG TPA: hypothetical protein [Bacteriophage sp.]